jgi:hypothetical protein
MKATYIGLFGDKKDIEKEFDEKLNDSVNIIFAYYNYQNYSGDAFVLFEQNGDLFEVHGSHCSCTGLERQWSPEETTLESLIHRTTVGTLGKHEYSDELKKCLKQFLN